MTMKNSSHYCCRSHYCRYCLCDCLYCCNCHFLIIVIVIVVIVVLSLLSLLLLSLLRLLLSLLLLTEKFKQQSICCCSCCVFIGCLLFFCWWVLFKYFHQPYCRYRHVVIIVVCIVMNHCCYWHCDCDYCCRCYCYSIIIVVMVVIITVSEQQSESLLWTKRVIYCKSFVALLWLMLMSLHKKYTEHCRAYHGRSASLFARSIFVACTIPKHKITTTATTMTTRFE